MITLLWSIMEKNKEMPQEKYEYYEFYNVEGISFGRCTLNLQGRIIEIACEFGHIHILKEFVGYLDRPLPASDNESVVLWATKKRLEDKLELLGVAINNTQVEALDYLLNNLNEIGKVLALKNHQTLLSALDINNPKIIQSLLRAYEKSNTTLPLDSRLSSYKTVTATPVLSSSTTSSTPGIAHSNTITPSTMVSSSSTMDISMMVLGGFIAAAGITAVAIAFTLLNAATFGITGLAVAGFGVAAALSGVGLFSIGVYKNRQTISKDSLDFSDNLVPQ